MRGCVRVRKPGGYRRAKLLLALSSVASLLTLGLASPATGVETVARAAAAGVGAPVGLSSLAADSRLAQRDIARVNVPTTSRTVTTRIHLRASNLNAGAAPKLAIRDARGIPANILTVGGVAKGARHGGTTDYWATVAIANAATLKSGSAVVGPKVLTVSAAVPSGASLHVVATQTAGWPSPDDSMRADARFCSGFRHADIGLRRSPNFRFDDKFLTGATSSGHRPMHVGSYVLHNSCGSTSPASFHHLLTGKRLTPWTPGAAPVVPGSSSATPAGLFAAVAANSTLAEHSKVTVAAVSPERPGAEAKPTAELKASGAALIVLVTGFSSDSPGTMPGAACQGDQPFGYTWPTLFPSSFNGSIVTMPATPTGATFSPTSDTFNCPSTPYAALASEQGDVPSNAHTLMDNLEELNQAGLIPSGGVWLVGHSMGGVWSRFGAAEYPQVAQDINLQGIVTLDSPHLGSYIGDFVAGSAMGPDWCTGRNPPPPGPGPEPGPTPAPCSGLIGLIKTALGGATLNDLSSKAMDAYNRTLVGAQLTLPVVTILSGNPNTWNQPQQNFYTFGSDDPPYVNDPNYTLPTDMLVGASSQGAAGLDGGYLPTMTNLKCYAPTFQDIHASVLSGEGIAEFIAGLAVGGLDISQVLLTDVTSGTAVTADPAVMTAVQVISQGAAGNNLVGGWSNCLSAFQQPLVPLTVNLTGVSADATVRVNGVAIPCSGNVCTANYFPGSYTLEATSDDLTQFVGWSGDGCSGSGSCTIDLTESSTVSAEYGYGLTVNVKGQGSILTSSAEVYCPQPEARSVTGYTCTGSTSAANTLTVAPYPGLAFAGWSGACTGYGACQVPAGSAENPVSVTATFGPANLTVNTTDNGVMWVQPFAGDGTVYQMPCQNNVCMLQIPGMGGELYSGDPNSPNSPQFVSWTSGPCQGSTADFCIFDTLPVTATGQFSPPSTGSAPDSKGAPPSPPSGTQPPSTHAPASPTG